jgi:hypothetical protein
VSFEEGRQRAAKRAAAAFGVDARAEQATCTRNDRGQRHED